MTYDGQLSIILPLVLMVGFPCFVIWWSYKAKDNTLKQTYQEIAQKNPKLQAYLNQGYDLLAVVRDEGLLNGVNFSVFNYPTRQGLNKLTLFRLTFELTLFPTRWAIFNIKHWAKNFVHLKDCTESVATEGYTHWLPFQVNGRNVDYSVNFSQNKNDFLSVLFPKDSIEEIFQKPMICKITGSAIPEGQTWQWSTTRDNIEEHKLVEVTNNNRVLVATFPPAGFIVNRGTVNYLVIHPEMPKHLVPCFVYLSILTSDINSC